MDINYQKRRQQLEKALITLEEVIAQQEESNIFLRDAMIQRFEYCVELFWKTLKKLLEVQEEVKAPTPTRAIRHAETINLLTPEETELALQMIHDRNKTSHGHYEPIAKNIALHVPDYCRLMQTVFSRLPQ